MKYFNNFTLRHLAIECSTYKFSENFIVVEVNVLIPEWVKQPVEQRQHFLHPRHMLDFQKSPRVTTKNIT